MNIRIGPVLVAVFMALSPLRAEETPPPLSFVKAALIAQETLEKLNLPDEFFIRVLSIVPHPDGTGISHYEARFEPVRQERVMVGQEPPATPITYRVIIIELDGTARIEEKTIDRSNAPRIMRRRAADAPAESAGGEKSP